MSKRLTGLKTYRIPRSVFKKGDPRINRKGRPKGLQNKITIDLKKAILGALERAGGEDWFFHLTKIDRKAFTSLIGRLLPTKIGGEEGAAPIALRVQNTVAGLSKLSDTELQVLIALLKKSGLDQTTTTTPGVESSPEGSS